MHSVQGSAADEMLKEVEDAPSEDDEEVLLNKKRTREEKEAEDRVCNASIYRILYHTQHMISILPHDFDTSHPLSMICRKVEVIIGVANVMFQKKAMFVPINHVFAGETRRWMEVRE